MKSEMLINVLQPEESRIAILEDGVLEELYIERNSQENIVGNIYKGKVVNIEPSFRQPSSILVLAGMVSCTSVMLSSNTTNIWLTKRLSPPAELPVDADEKVGPGVLPEMEMIGG
ncbi:MAG: hypothetical protein R3C11_16610 [Planctomycetaceae bacterium]